MTWVKRGLWAAAWGVWVWLGFGLYRELPRGWGTTLRPPRLAPGSRPLGFLHGKNDVAVLKWTPGTRGEVFDAETGITVRTVSDLPITGNLQHRLDPCHRNVLFNYQLFNPDRPKGLYKPELDKGEWKRLWDQPSDAIDLHHRRPWVALAEKADGPPSQRVVVLDYQSGDVIGATNEYPAGSIVGPPRWVGDERLLVCDVRPRYGSEAIACLHSHQPTFVMTSAALASSRSA